jgi:hypothetical protein
VFRVLVLVWKMRKAQKAFFKEGKKKSDLIESKRLEGEVDKMLKAHLYFENGEPAALVMIGQDDEPKQANLFVETNDGKTS